MREPSPTQNDYNDEIRHAIWILQQERWIIAGVLQKGTLSFVIRIFNCCILVLCILSSVFGVVHGCLKQEMQSLLVFKGGLHDPAGG